jgi:hypothetical protein
MRGVMFIGYAIETLRDEVPLHAASTPDVEAILAADCCVKEASRPIEGCSAVRDSDCDPGLGSFIRKMRHYGEPHACALNGELVNDPLRG